MDSINEYLYEARLAGLNFNFDVTSRGISLTFSGFSDKMSIFAESILQIILEYKPSNGEILRYKDLLQREYMGWKTQQPYSHASYFASQITETLQYPIPVLLDIIQKLDLNKFDNHRNKNSPFSMNKLLKKTFGTALIMGNIDEEGVEKFVKVVDGQLFDDKKDDFEILQSKDRSRRDVLKLPLGSNVLINEEPNKDDDNSCCVHYYQLPTRNDKEKQMLLELLSVIMEQPFYDELRTKQQLGYIVYSGIRYKESIPTLCFIVQSSLINSNDIQDRIDSYLNEFILHVEENVKEDEFKSFKNGLIETKLEEDQRLTSQAGRFWSEISNENEIKQIKPQFDRAINEVKILEKLKIADLVAFAKDIIQGDEKRLLVSQVNSAKSTNNVKNIKQTREHVIDNPGTFINTNSYL
jgi:insulysin